MAAQEWRRILVPEGLIEDVLRTTHHFTEEYCRGLFAAVETMLHVETEFESYRDLKATKASLGHGDVWLLDESTKQERALQTSAKSY